MRISSFSFPPTPTPKEMGKLLPNASSREGALLTPSLKPGPACKEVRDQPQVRSQPPGPHPQIAPPCPLHPEPQHAHSSCFSRPHTTCPAQRASAPAPGLYPDGNFPLRAHPFSPQSNQTSWCFLLCLWPQAAPHHRSPAPPLPLRSPHPHPALCDAVPHLSPVLRSPLAPKSCPHAQTPRSPPLLFFSLPLTPSLALVGPRAQVWPALPRRASPVVFPHQLCDLLGRNSFPTNEFASPHALLAGLKRGLSSCGRRPKIYL